METIQGLHNKLKKDIDELLNNYGAFFAFGKKQFDEQKKEGVKYINGGAGIIIPKSKYQEFITKLDKLQDDHQNYILNNKKLKNKYILYQLLNHEAFYTGDYYETFKILGKGYTLQEVQKIYNLNRAKYED